MAVDLPDVELFTLVPVFGLTLFQHGYGIKPLLLFQCQHCFGRRKPAVKQDVFGCDARTLCRMSQLYHDVCSFTARLKTPPSCKGAPVIMFALTEQVLFLCSRKQAVTDRDKGIPI